jgi:hypothetical protein
VKVIYSYVKFEVFTAVTMKNVVFWDVTPCRSCMNRRFVGTYRFHLQGRNQREQVAAVCAASQKTALFMIYLAHCRLHWQGFVDS